MKMMIRIGLSLCFALLSATPASAYPYSGWWGAGYYGSPSYYAPSYTSYYGSGLYTSYYGSSNYASPSYGCCGTAAPVYSAGYGSCGTGCCATNSYCGTSCCDPCGSGCASGSCAGTTPAGSLKPAQDPISDRKAPAYEENPPSRRFNPDDTAPRTPRKDDKLDPVDAGDGLDPFVRPGQGSGGRTNPGSGSGTSPGMFDDTIDPARDRTLQKPPMTDPLDGKALDPVDGNLGNPVDEKTFYEDTTKPNTSASRHRDPVIAHTSSLSEVIAPKRLASRSLPASHRSVSSSKLADTSNEKTKAESTRPVRWISAPLADGHVQL